MKWGKTITKNRMQKQGKNNEWIKTQEEDGKNCI
jgi:hypothetical protein